MNNAKWVWLMDYCKTHQLPPAQRWAWEKAEKEFYILKGKRK